MTDTKSLITSLVQMVDVNVSSLVQMADVNIGFKSGVECRCKCLTQVWSRWQM